MEDPDIFLIQETKCAGKTAEDIIKRCWRNFESYQMDSKGASGGPTILWNPTTVILDQSLSTPCTIIAHYRAIGLDKEGMITNSYGLADQPRQRPLSSEPGLFRLLSGG
jgi:hypothetical protein